MLRLNKIFLIIFLVLFAIAGLSLLVTGSVAHHQASQYAEITGHSLMSGAGFIIALGVFILLLSVFGFITTIKNRTDLLKIFIVLLALIVLLELIAAIVGFTLRNKGDQQLRKRLLDSLKDYKEGKEDVVREWDLLQQQWSCCGVNQSSDWQNEVEMEQPPKSCCLNDNCQTMTNTTAYFDNGCYESARTLFFRYSKALGGVSLFFFFVELIGLDLAIVVFRDAKNNYGAV